MIEYKTISKGTQQFLEDLKKVFEKHKAELVHEHYALGPCPPSEGFKVIIRGKIPGRAIILHFNEDLCRFIKGKK